MTTAHIGHARGRGEAVAHIWDLSHPFAGEGVQ